MVNWIAVALAAEAAVLAALLKILLEENGTAGIGDENS